MYKVGVRMKKGIKTSLVIIASIILIVIIMAVLIIMQIIPNPFLNKKDLMCAREADQIIYYTQELVTVSFDKWGKANSSEMEVIYVYEDEISAEQDFEELQKDSNGDLKSKLKVDKNKIIITKENENFPNIKSRIRKDIKLMYKEYQYECN